MSSRTIISNKYKSSWLYIECVIYKKNNMRTPAKYIKHYYEIITQWMDYGLITKVCITVLFTRLPFLSYLYKHYVSSL